MPITVEPNAFASQEEAVALIESRGYATYPSDRDANQVGAHWHDFDAMLAIVAGMFELTDVELDLRHVIEPGTVFEVTDRALHIEKHGPYKVVFGFKTNPLQFEEPINRDPADHPDLD